MSARACLLAAAALALLAAPASTAPAPADDSKPEIIEIIAPANSAQETLATLSLGAPGSELSERNKRTIGILRQLFPSLTQIIEQKVQQITSFVLKTFGPVLLKSFLGNRNGGGGGGGGGGSGTIELDDDDDDDDDDVVEPTTTAPTATASTATGGGRPDSEPGETSSAVDTARDEPEERRRRRRALFFVSGAAGEDNQLLSGAESQQAEVRVAFADQQQPADDQQPAAQTANLEEISLDDADDTEENRNKRFLSFGGGSGGSGGGSGNFLFDIVRRAPEAMARAAGSAFRLLAGTESLRVGLSASHSAALEPQLVAGSSSGSSSEAGGADGEEGGAPKGDNLTEGVPGPITRLFIIANRGIANLIQDLILRIAQTSERIVNFKARLITSII